MVKRPARTPQHTSISMVWIKELSDKLFSFYINGVFWAFCDSFMQDTFNLKEFCLRLSNKIDLPISLSPVLLGAALEGGLQLEQPQVVKIPKWPPLLPAVCLPASQVCEARRFPHFHCARLHCCILPSACFCAQAVWMTAGRQLHQLWMSGKALPSAVLCWISLPARCTPPHANNQGSPSSPGPRAGGRPPVSVLQQHRERPWSMIQVRRGMPCSRLFQYCGWKHFGFHFCKQQKYCPFL